MEAVLEPPKLTVKWTDHPLIDRLADYTRLTDAEFERMVATCGPEAALAYHAEREKRIDQSINDPFKYEFPLLHWADLENEVMNHIVTFIPGGNNPGKSRWAASFALRVLLGKIKWNNDRRLVPKVLMISQDDTVSKMFQQDKVYQQLPIEWRRQNESTKKAPRFSRSINYSYKNGFTDKSLVLPSPRQGQLWFRTVAQYNDNAAAFEGPEYDLVVIDEGCPLMLFRTLLGRVAKRGGKIVYLLTCIHGYDQTLGSALMGAQMVSHLPMNFMWDEQTTIGVPVGHRDPDVVYPEIRMAEHQSEQLRRLGCPAGHMPYKMQPINPHWKVVFMWNIWNPFQARSRWNPKMPAQMDACVGDPKWRVLVKMFGWIEKMGQLALGNFNPEIHVVRGKSRELLDEIVKTGKCTVYMADDPETQRSHAILWQATFPPCTQWPNGLKYLFDESPRMNEGEWATAEAERGEGQYVYKATGANWYKRYIREREKEWNICDELCPVEGCRPLIVQRRGDPRGFATAESTATGTRSMFDLYQEDHSPEDKMFAPMLFAPARIRRASSLDLDGLIDLFRFDEEKYRTDGGFTAENTPGRLVSDRCENWMRCALNYTLTDLGKADETNPHRDFIDADRYLNSTETTYFDPEASQVTGGGPMQ